MAFSRSIAGGSVSGRREALSAKVDSDPGFGVLPVLFFSGELMMQKRATGLASVAAVCGLAACGPTPNNHAAQGARRDQLRTTPWSAAQHVAGARMAALTGDQKALQGHVDAMSKDILHDAHIPDPTRPIPHEAARTRIAQVDGVRSVAWIDHDNLLVLVGGPQYRDMAMVDRVCETLAPLGDTLGVVVNVQDVTATTSHAADAVSRDCQLPEGQRAFLQRQRQIEALDPATRRAFESQQPSKQH